jgi:uncharacterized membrane protein
MPFCASCGSSVDGKFCPKCGAPIAGAAGAAPPPPSPMGVSQPSISTPLDTNVVSALCYLGFVVTGIIFLVVEPYSKNREVRFHAFQSIFFTVVGFVIHLVVMNVLWSSLFSNSFFSLWGVWELCRLAYFLVWIWLMVQAFQGKRVVLPVIGQIAEKQAQN